MAAGQRWATGALAWLRSPTPTFADLPPLAAWDRWLATILPVVFAVSSGFQLTAYVIAPNGIGIDARLYALAAQTWLAGGDPWSVSLLGITFAAPPPTLLVIAPLAFLPEATVVPVTIAACLLLVTAAIRSLGLPLWWLAFPPTMHAIVVGNPDALVLAALVVLGRRLDPIAPFAKIYAIAPMVADRRWRSLLIVAVLIVATIPILPWQQWIAAGPSLSEALAGTSASTSVYGQPVLMAIGIVALLALGVRRAGWLAVPVLWPWTQPHYMTMSVPALTPMLAIVWSIPWLPPLLVLGSVVVAAIGYRLLPLAAPRPTHLATNGVHA